MKEFTFGQAKKLLNRAPYVQGTADIGERINAAIAALTGLNGWEFLRRLVRMSSATPVFSLPQGVAGLVRACVNGRPSSIHGTDYQFLHSGPGDLESYVSRGFRILRTTDVADIGYSPTLFPIVEPMFLAATSARVDAGRAQAPLTVTGLAPDGVRVTRKYEVTQGVYGQPPEYTAFYDGGDVTFMSIESVVLDANADEYISLWGMTPGGTTVMLGHYHPSIQVPKFRQYRISAPGPGPYDILAEVRVDPLPLIDDSDVIPIPSIEPIKLMMLYETSLVLNELTTAQQYLQQATQWLQQMQVADNTVQSPVVQNTLFEGSGGELSATDNSWNL